MHAEAYEYVRQQVAHKFFGHVIEFGSLDINGSVRPLFNCDFYHGIDLQSGPGVNQIADAATWISFALADVIVCCEVLEHSPSAKAIVNNAYINLRPGGLFIMTCATNPRPEHSAIDGGKIRPWEHYRNIDPKQFYRWCFNLFDITSMQVHDIRGDLYATGVKI